MRKTALVGIIMVALLANTGVAAYAGGEVYYTVKPGDTLYGIGKKFGLHYGTLMETNDLESTTIVPGFKLSIPSGGFHVYTVKSGDTLYGISRRYGTNVTGIKTASGLNSAHIRPGMKLLVPNNRKTAGEVRPVFGQRFPVSSEDIRLLARLISAEARGEPLEGQIAVGAVILNRIASGRFPDTIREVIFQKTNGVYQFTPVQDGQINREPHATAFYAAEQAIRGHDPSGGALFFYNPETSSDTWIRTLPVTRVIGNHVFAK